MLENNCVGCYWPRSSNLSDEPRKPRSCDSVYELKPRLREKIYDSETELFATKSSSSSALLDNTDDRDLLSSSTSPGCWREVRSLPRRRGRDVSNERRKGETSTQSCKNVGISWLNLMSDCRAKPRLNLNLEADFSNEEDQQVLHDEDENTTDIHALHQSYQGKRFDFVDDILESSLIYRRQPQGDRRHNLRNHKPFIQSVDDQQVLVDKVEPLHLSHAMRRRDHIFHCYEFLLLTRLNGDKELWNKLCDRFGYCDECRGLKGCSSRNEHSSQHKDAFRISAIKPELWFLAVALKDSKDKLIHFIRTEMPRRNFLSSDLNSDIGGDLKSNNSSFLSSYLSAFNFVELRLDNVLETGCELPPDIYRCTNVRTLSLKNNFLKSISPEIGKMSKLERLFLTNNQLANNSIPFTLAFCGRLSEVYLDNNLLDALPCILLRVKTLHRVHRHGNHNYFKDTFMFYHTDINDRILEIRGVRSNTMKSLQNLAGNAVLSSRHNFYRDQTIPPAIKAYLTTLAEAAELCDKCSAVLEILDPRCSNEFWFRVFTFKNPYLGNTCVPFQHTACSSDCARSIEIPARQEQLSTARQQDWEYEQYIRESMMYLEDMERGACFNGSGGIWTDTIRSRTSRRSSTGSKSGMLSPVGSRSGSSLALRSNPGPRSGRSSAVPRGIGRSSVTSGLSGSQTALSSSRASSLTSLRQVPNTCGIF